MAGFFNTRLNTVWNLCCIAEDPDWMYKTRAEIDAIIEKHRRSHTESRSDVLYRLTLREWETEFPLLELAMRETLRFTMSSTLVRKNISGRDIKVGDTDEVIPSNSVVVSRGVYWLQISAVALNIS
jgi:sterol 14-demethylase